MKNISIRKKENSYFLKAGCNNGSFSFYFDCTEYLSAKQFGIVLFDLKTGAETERIIFSDDFRTGNLFSVYIDGFNPNKHSYCFFADDCLITDKRAEKYIDVPAYGEFTSKTVLKAAFSDIFDWEDDALPDLAFDKCFIYQLHARGFTKHSSSGTRYKGTFKGIADKLDYLHDLGVTTIDLQPINEFVECDNKTGRLNYWGYCQGLYYSPKRAYSYSDNPQKEFKELVKKAHKTGIEVIIQLFFPVGFNRSEIVSVLEFWASEYHIDGFHLLGETLPIELINDSAILKNIKIISDNLGNIANKKYALCNNDYLNKIRRFIKADENSLAEAVYAMRNNPSQQSVLNYIDTFNTFTLFDMVSYDHKHNESNGEDNNDGSDYNCSWNCGEEGNSRKQSVVSLRKKQIKNALLLLFLSAGTPMIFMGDEFGNSQMGNNNPYCHDDETTWLNWSQLKKQYSFVDFIVNINKCKNDYAVLKADKELSMLDINNCGFPEISYHGESAWKAQVDGNRHDIGIMYCDNGRLLYAAVNMHWNTAVLSLPRAPKGMEWKMYLTTDPKVLLTDELKVEIPERTIALFVSVKKSTDAITNAKTEKTDRVEKTYKAENTDRKNKTDTKEI